LFDAIFLTENSVRAGGERVLEDVVADGGLAASHDDLEAEMLYRLGDERRARSETAERVLDEGVDEFREPEAARLAAAQEASKIHRSFVHL